MNTFLENVHPEELENEENEETEEIDGFYDNYADFETV